MRRIPIALLAATAALTSVGVHAQEDGNSFTDRARRAGEAAATAPVPAEAGATEGGEAAPVEGEVMLDPIEQPGGAPANPSAIAENMDAYTIQQGDTLWDICARLLGDPFYWPKLWSLNQYITNPHWIYPGNLLVFKEGTETAPPQFEVTRPEAVPMVEAPVPLPVPTPLPIAEAEPQPIEPAPRPVAATPVTAETLQEGFTIPTEEAPVQTTVAAVDPYAIPQSVGLTFNPYEIKLRQEGFISETQIPPLGYIYKSEEERTNLAENDRLYIRLNDASQAQVGSKFTVYRTLRRVKHPTSRGYMGFLVKILAELEVTAVNGEVANCRVVTSYDYINRGDPITEYVSILKNIALSPNSTSIEGMIVETMVDGVSILGNGDVIYIDKGTADGLSIGNTVDVVRKGDGLIRNDNDARLPQEVVGRLVIVGVKERTATAVIVDSYDALQIGDKIRVSSN